MLRGFEILFKIQTFQPLPCMQAYIQNKCFKLLEHFSANPDHAMLTKNTYLHILNSANKGSLLSNAKRLKK